VLANVVSADINPKTKVISTQALDSWDLHRLGSNLLGVIREIHMKFDANPPIPEKMANEMHN